MNMMPILIYMHFWYPEVRLIFIYIILFRLCTLYIHIYHFVYSFNYFNEILLYSGKHNLCYENNCRNFYKTENLHPFQMICLNEICKITIYLR